MFGIQTVVLSELVGLIEEFTRCHMQVFMIQTSTPNNNTILGVTAGCTTLFEHEDGFNDDGAAMDCQITSGDFDIKEGDEVREHQELYLDFKDQSGDTTMKIEFANYPASTNTRSFTSTTSPTTKFFSVRGRGRQANIKISSNAIDSN